MDIELRRMLVKTITIRHKTGETSGGTPTLGSAIQIAAHVESEKAVGSDPGGTTQTLGHWITTQDEIVQDDRIWLPDDDVSNMNLGRLIIGTVKIFYDPETGVADHWEVKVA